MLLVLSLFFCFNLSSECVTKDGVGLRLRPSKKAALTWEVRKYFPFKKLKKETKYWTQILDLYGNKHWIPKMHYTKRYHCVIVKADESRIKEEPRIASKDKYREPAFKYETFRFLRAKRGWIKVQDVHGDTGWLLYKDVWVD